MRGQGLRGETWFKSAQKRAKRFIPAAIILLAPLRFGIDPSIAPAHNARLHF